MDRRGRKAVGPDSTHNGGVQPSVLVEHNVEVSASINFDQRMKHRDGAEAVKMFDLPLAA